MHFNAKLSAIDSISQIVSFKKMLRYVFLSYDLADLICDFDHILLEHSRPFTNQGLLVLFLMYFLTFFVLIIDVRVVKTKNHRVIYPVTMQHLSFFYGTETVLNYFASIFLKHAIFSYSLSFVLLFHIKYLQSV